MSTLCPAAAAACSQAISLGRALRPSFCTPRAIAPLDTRTTPRRSPPASPRAAAISAASRSHASPVSPFDPILMTTRRARESRARTAPSSITGCAGGSPPVAEGASASDILEPGDLGDDLVERRLEPSLDVAGERRAREEHGVDPARELVAQILHALVHRGRRGPQARGEGAN